MHRVIMKRLFLAAALLISVFGSAQYGFYGLYTPKSSSWGFAVNGLTPQLPHKFFRDLPVKFQLGIGYQLINGGQKKIRAVELTPGASPVDVSFSNLQHTIYGAVRISFPVADGRFIPFAEIQPGMRMYNSNVRIDSLAAGGVNTYMPNKSSSFNLGMSGGLMAQLNETFALEAGVTWDNTADPGNLINLNSVNVSDGVSYGLRRAPLNSLTFRLGVRISFIKKGCCPVPGCRIPRHHTSCGNEHIQN
jgi:hypothetical protein